MKVSSFLARGLAAVVLCSTSAVAQQKFAVGHGSWLVGGTAGWSHNHTDGGPSTTTVAVQPFGLYFVADRLGLGGTLDLGYASGSVAGNDSHNTVIGFEPTIRYFFGDPAGKLFPYVNAAVGPSWERFKVDGGSGAGEQTTHGLALTGSVGLMRMLATHVGLSGEVYYTALHRSTDLGTVTAKQDNNSYGLRFGFNAFVF